MLGSLQKEKLHFVILGYLQKKNAFRSAQLPSEKEKEKFCNAQLLFEEEITIF